MPSPQDGNGQALETPFGETLVLETDQSRPGRGAREAAGLSARIAGRQRVLHRRRRR
jgi:hypothetical protein